MDKKKQLLIIILVGGIAVLLSYVLGPLTRPGAAGLLWGGVPEGIRPFYTVGMFLGAGGYFAFTYFLLFRLAPEMARVAGRFGFGLFEAIYVAILLPSALWMPLTLLAAEQPGQALLWLVRLDLWTVAVASLGLYGLCWLLSLANPAGRTGWPWSAVSFFACKQLSWMLLSG